MAVLGSAAPGTPGLPDRTPALSLEGQMVSTMDGDGCDVRRRVPAHILDEAASRRSQFTGQV